MSRNTQSITHHLTTAYFVIHSGAGGTCADRKRRLQNGAECALMNQVHFVSPQAFRVMFLVERAET